MRYTWTNSMILVGKKRHKNAVRKGRNWKRKTKETDENAPEKMDSRDNDGKKYQLWLRFYFSISLSFSFSFLVVVVVQHAHFA